MASSIGVTALFMVTLLLVPAAYAQKLEIRNKSRIRLGSTQISETVTLSDKRYSLSFKNTFRERRKLNNVLSGRFNPTKSTKLYLNTEFRGGVMTWEAKVNQKYEAFTLDLGTGSAGLFHAGVMYGKRKGKGFGLSASWVGDNRRRGANLQIWHYLEKVDLVASVRHDRRGFGWSLNTGKKMANILRGILLYETNSGSDGNPASQQVIYGRSMRDGGDTYTGFDSLDIVPNEDVFGEDGINIRSPLYPDDDPLAWLVEGYGVRFGQVELDRESQVEAEMVSYLTDSIWVGGDFVMEDGITKNVDTKFGITSQNMKLAAAFGYAPQSERFSGSVQFQWTPIRPSSAGK
mgnify:FL=1|tara:strand:+ start:7848 stop:8888 length:1041 start_codon:yes stop_codon:yes gene_type:complete